MKRNIRRHISVAMSVVCLSNSMPVLAIGSKASFVAPNNKPPVSGRLIVKFKPNNLPKGLSVAQINAQLRQPLTAQAVTQLQMAAGTALTEFRATANGAHVLYIAGQPNRKTLSMAIAGIGNLPNIEYVEEDRIMTAQAAPNDPFYTTGPTGNPGLWGMQPASEVAAPAPGGTGSYGADFEITWATSTGTGVVVAVVDTGITPNVDIVGPAATVAAGAGSNLVSVGYDFISDCRMRGSCAVTTPNANAVVAASPDATDLGDFISAADSTTNGSAFFGWPVQNSSWHGTHVAGTIAALGNNGAGVIGGAYNAKILPVRVLGKGGGSMSDIADGIMWAAGAHPTIVNPNPAKVINISLGGGGACSITEQTAINAAVAAGATVVVAAGNSNQDVANFSPANCQNVITVAATGRDGSRAGYSNFSSPATNTINPTNVTLAAQGSDMAFYPPTFDPGILSTLNTGLNAPVMTAGGSNYVYYQGTSMATPHVAAAAALMLAKNPALTPAQVKTILSAPASLTAFPSFDPASTIAPPAYDCAFSKNCGTGILNANLAVQNSIQTLSGPATAVDFGAIPIGGGAGLPQTITLTNTSKLLPVQPGAATVTGANAALFTIGANTCSGATLAPNGTCQVTLSYAPTAAGVHTASLSVAATGLAAPALVSLTGTAGAPLTTTPNVTAATVNVGQSTTVNLSYTNANTTAWKVGVVTMSQPTLMATSVDNCSNTTLAAGASCTATVTITPATAGAYTGTASLGLAGGGIPAVATIAGTANTAPAAVSSGGGGGGGCTIMPAGAIPDSSLPLAMLAILAYWLRQRMFRTRGEA